jgi:hypothetical protein
MYCVADVFHPVDHFASKLFLTWMCVIAVGDVPQVAQDQRPYPVRGFDKWHRLGNPSQLCG